MSDNELLAIARQIGFNVEKVSVQLMLKALAEQIKVKMLDKEAA
jgi:hypothetical protein